MKISTETMFDGGGEMGSLMRSFDWSKTALGPISQWSQALKNMVSVLLRSPFPMYLAWGPQLVQFYNDAHRPIMSARHPNLMGQSANESWAEVWHIVDPSYSGPLAGQPVFWSDDKPLLLNRKGFLEET